MLIKTKVAHKFSGHDIEAGSTVKLVRDKDLKNMWFAYHPATSVKPFGEWGAEYINHIAGREVVKA